MRNRMLLALLVMAAVPAWAADASPRDESPFYRNQYAVSHLKQGGRAETANKTDEAKPALTNESQEASAQRCACHRPTT